jgi:hypothetical protein
MSKIVIKFIAEHLEDACYRDGPGIIPRDLLKDLCWTKCTVASIPVHFFGFPSSYNSTIVLLPVTMLWGVG